MLSEPQEILVQGMKSEEQQGYLSQVDKFKNCDFDSEQAGEFGAAL
jgi:hypothetical protein